MKKHKNLAGRRLKPILFISLTLFSIQSIRSEDTEAQGWYQQAQQQLYGIGQKGWEKTKEGIAWIKAHPKEAAALGLGAAALVGTRIYQAKKRRMPKQEEPEPGVPQWVQQAREERKKLQDKLKGLIYVRDFAHISMKWDPTQALRLVYTFDSDTFYNIYNYHLTGGLGPMDIHLWGPIPKFDLKDILKKTYIDGYSAISAVIVSQKKSLQEKKIFIKFLLEYFGIKPTQKDCELSKLELWERDPKVQMLSDIQARVAAEQPAQSYLEVLPLPLIEQVEKLSEEPLIPRRYCDIYVE